jgi:hypothetical protein
VRSFAVAFLLVLACSSCRRTPPPAPSETADADVPSSGPGGVLESGREPRRLVTFVFVPGRHEARLLEVESRVEHEGALKMSDRVELRLEVRYLQADTVELVVRRAQTAATDVPRIESTVGGSFKVHFGKDGAAETPVAVFPESTDGVAQSYVQGVVSQVAPSLLPVVPSTPIGEGARWRVGTGEGPVHQLVSLKDGGLVVEQRGELRGQRRTDRKMIEVNEDHDTRIDAPFDGIARHVETTVVEKRPHGYTYTTRLRFEPIDAP